MIKFVRMIDYLDCEGTLSESVKRSYERVFHEINTQHSDKEIINVNIIENVSYDLDSNPNIKAIVIYKERS